MGNLPGHWRLLPFIVLLIAGLFAAEFATGAEQRFPRPEFQTEYSFPDVQDPAPRATWTKHLDVAVLALSLVAAAWLGLRTRSRSGLVWIAILGVVYFGFWRRGCVCAVGSVQNVSQALADPAVGVAWTTMLFFALPVVFAVYVGRSFCAGVCPLGAIQDLVLIRPVRVPAAIDEPLRLLRHLYLGLGILLAATATGYLICRMDPFIAIFRFSGPTGPVIFGLGLLAIATMIGRPYCRYLCPFGVLLGWGARISRRHMTITPDDCIHCGLCSDACPFNAIHAPVESKWGESRAHGIRRLAHLVILAPLIILAAAWIGHRLTPRLVWLHQDTRILQELRTSQPETPLSAEGQGYVDGGGTVEELTAQVNSRRHHLALGGWFVGAFIGLAAASRAIEVSTRHPRKDYWIERSRCVSCGRCFAACPREQVRRRGLQGE